MKVASGGSLEVEGGDSFTLTGNLDNVGTIDLAPGTLNVGGTYTQEASAALSDVAVGGLAAGSAVRPAHRDQGGVPQRRRSTSA